VLPVDSNPDSAFLPSLCSAQMQALVNELTKLVGGGIEVIRNPVMDNADERLLGPSHEGVATFQKVVLAHSTVFLGNLLSTFSMDIERMRVGWGTWDCREPLHLRREWINLSAYLSSHLTSDSTYQGISSMNFSLLSEQSSIEGLLEYLIC